VAAGVTDCVRCCSRGRGCGWPGWGTLRDRSVMWRRLDVRRGAWDGAAPEGAYEKIHTAVPPRRTAAPGPAAAGNTHLTQTMRAAATSTNAPAATP
jgi:hypothetical protein